MIKHIWKLIKIALEIPQNFLTHNNAFHFCSKSGVLVTKCCVFYLPNMSFIYLLTKFTCTVKTGVFSKQIAQTRPLLAIGQSNKQTFHKLTLLVGSEAHQSGTNVLKVLHNCSIFNFSRNSPTSGYYRDTLVLL